MRNYSRVIPRDLFNEASLLKCYGRLYILLENTPGHRASLLEHDEGAPFAIAQDQGTGAIYIDNIGLMVGRTTYCMTRPLNSRAAWPLWVENDEDDDFETFEVFDTTGNLSPEMLAFIGAQPC